MSLMEVADDACTENRTASTRDHEIEIPIIKLHFKSPLPFESYIFVS
jgi:hypothetical protein